MSTLTPSCSPAITMIDQRGLATIKVLNECLDPTFVFQHDGRGFDARHGQHYQTPEFRKASSRNLCSKVDRLNSVIESRRRHKSHRSAFFAIGVADDLKRASDSHG